MPKRQIFYSFHYMADSWRASQIRNIGVVEGNPPATDNDWETIKRGGDVAIAKWITDQMQGRTCTIVLIGKETANRKWINYEISESWKYKKGVFGIYIHNIKDSFGCQAQKGLNPFDFVNFEGKTLLTTGQKMSALVKTYDPPYSDSKQVYDYISNNLAAWIEAAIQRRQHSMHL